MRSVLVAVMVLCAGVAGAQTVTDGSGALLPPGMLKKTLYGLSSTLRNPDEAKIRRLRVIEGPIVCGQVNSANGYGGLTGYKMFLVNMRNSSVGVYNDEADSFTQALKAQCYPGQ